jgi:hypothetical protein
MSTTGFVLVAAVLAAGALIYNRREVLLTFGTTPFIATADATIKKEAPDVKYGNSSELIARYRYDDQQPNTYQRLNKFYVRFDIPTTGRICRATLQFETIHKHAEAHFKVYGLNEQYDTWDESTINANMAPGHDQSLPWSSFGMKNYETTFVGRFSFPDDHKGHVTMASTRELVLFLRDDTDGKVTFIIVRETCNDQETVFSARGTNSWSPPTLTITTRMWCL